MQLLTMILDCNSIIAVGPQTIVHGYTSTSLALYQASDWLLPHMSQLSGTTKPDLALCAVIPGHRHLSVEWSIDMGADSAGRKLLLTRLCMSNNINWRVYRKIIADTADRVRFSGTMTKKLIRNIRLTNISVKIICYK